jgi:CRISPR/Cas system CSM-associated protein Csm5 (group 7 of RAMP superfamily)
MDEDAALELSMLRKTIEKQIEKQDETNDLMRALTDALKGLAQEMEDARTQH